MPELPEVETVRRYLDENIVGHKITSVFLSNKKSLRNVSEEKLQSIVGQNIIGTDRLAKHLIVNLENDYLIMHLRMEGKFFVFESREDMERITNRFYDVLIIETDKSVILFQDTRRFATIDMFSNDITKEENSVLIKVGKEPFDLSGSELFDKLQKKRVAIKSALLDQSIISGIGNIYVDEILFKVKLHPETKSNAINLDKANEIIEAARKILAKAVELKGSTIKSYTSSLGVEGQYQNFLNVHQQLGKNCKLDNTPIVKIKVGGRGTYICPTCQKINN